MTTPDARRAYAREYYQRNKDKFKQYYRDNKASINNAARRWQAENPARYLWLQAKSRARKAGLPFNLDPSDVVIPEVCPVFGTPLFRANGKQGLADNAPSIDRTDPTGGYVKGNIAVISGKANRLKNRWTAPELRRKADWLESSRKTKPDDLRRIADWLDSLQQNAT